MKRFAAIVTIVVVVLAMSAGTAFASVCAGGTCASITMVCSEAGTASCPMGVTQMLHSSCAHPMDRGSHDGVASTQTVDQAVVSSFFAQPAAGPVLRALVPASAAVDARGAPHLTSVIRI